MTQGAIGDAGERVVVAKVPCPNCGKKLMVLPPGFPLFDVQCTRCLFRAQVKTCNSRPVSRIRGAGWDVLDMVFRSGHPVPPLMVNFSWVEGRRRLREVRFYPFIPKETLEKYRLNARQGHHRRFNYTRLAKIPHFVLYSTFRPEEVWPTKTSR